MENNYSSCNGSMERMVALPANQPIGSNFNDFSQFSGETGEDLSQLTGEEQYSNLFSGMKQRRKDKHEAKMAKKAAKTEVKLARADSKRTRADAKLTKAQGKQTEADAGKISASQEGEVAKAIAGQPDDDKSKKVMLYGGIALGVLVLGGIAFAVMRKKSA
jgi:hypothetical protein